MATSYPTSKQSFTNPSGTSDTNVVDHAGMHTNTNDTLGALQDTLGYSADTATSVLGRLSAITGSDVAVGKSATQTLLNKTLVAPVVNGSSGNMNLLASSDGSEYNINSSTSGTLSIYGQAAATLHLNLLDGNLQTNGTTRLTNAGVMQNVSIDGSSNTLTNIGTSALQNNAVTAAKLGTVVTTGTLNVAFNSASVTSSSATLVQGSAGNGVYKFTGTLNISSLAVPSSAVILSIECWLNLSGNTSSQGSVRCAIGSYSNTSFVFVAQGAGNDSGTFPNLSNTAVDCFVRYIA